MQHSRRVIGWMIDEHMRTDPVQDDLHMAITLRDELPGKSCSTPIPTRSANRPVVLRHHEDRDLLPPI